MLPGIHRDVVDFVMSRWQTSGGFGFVPTLPASVEDTYHAVRILETILPLSEAEVGELKTHPKLKAFLGRKEDKDAWSLKTAYQYLHLCGFCNFRPDAAWLTTFIEARFNGVFSLTDQYYLARIRKEFSRVSPTAWGSMSSEDRVDEWRTAEALYMLWYIHEGTAKPLPATSDELVQWLQACQTPDGGFGGLPGTTSFIENTHWCLRALGLLGGMPLFPDMAQEFILRCKTRGGGFARKSGGAPFLYATWHAVASLSILPEPSQPFIP